MPDSIDRGRATTRRGPWCPALAMVLLGAVLAVGAPMSDPAGATVGKTLVQIGAGGVMSCGLATDNTIMCWGRNTHGELGDGSGNSSPTPVAVKTAGTPLAGKTIAKISVGSAHTCALTTDGVLACWGVGMLGRLGNGDGSDRPVPTAVTTRGRRWPARRSPRSMRATGPPVPSPAAPRTAGEPDRSATATPATSTRPLPS